MGSCQIIPSLLSSNISQSTPRHPEKKEETIGVGGISNTDGADVKLVTLEQTKRTAIYQRRNQVEIVSAGKKIII